MASAPQGPRSHSSDAADLLFSQALQGLRDSVVITDLDDRIVAVNQAFLQRYGYEYKEVVGKDLALLWQGSDAAVDSSEVRRLPQEVTGVWIYNRTKDGARFPVFLSRAVIQDQDNQAIGTVGVVREVSELSRTKEALEEAENRFQQLAETIDQVFFLTDPDRTGFLYLSPQFESFWGCSVKSVYKNPQRFYEMIHPDERERIRLRSAELSSGSYDEEYRIVRPDGMIRWVRERAYPIHDAEGAVARVSGIIDDITAERSAEQRQEQLQAELRHSQKMEAIGQLAGGIAHDFNNILGSIIGYTEMAVDDLEPGTLPQSNLAEVLTAANRAKRLVGQILTFSRRTIRNARPVDFVEIVAETLRLIRATLPSTVEIEKDVPQGQISVMGDSDQLHSVVLNLCTNAAQAMQLSGGVLSVALSTLEQAEAFKVASSTVPPGRFAVLEVKDTGSGMDEATLSRIFEPFYTTKPPGQGTGLGLSVVHGIIQEHEGYTAVESTPGVGSVFSILLPIIDEAAQADSDAADGVMKGSGRILFIDDEDSLVELAHLMLGRLGYEVTGFCSPIEALEYFSAKPYSVDLVITDATMPKMPGDVLGRKIREIRPDIPVILCSGYTERINYELALEQGFVEFISKPISFAKMARVLRAVLEQGQDGSAQ